MLDPQDPKQMMKLATARMKIDAYITIGWGLAVLFLMVGSCAGHREQAVAGMIMVTLIWVMCEITSRAIAAWNILKIMKQMGDDPAALFGVPPVSQEEEKKEENDDRPNG